MEEGQATEGREKGKARNNHLSFRCCLAARLSSDREHGTAETARRRERERERESDQERERDKEWEGERERAISNHRFVVC